MRGDVTDAGRTPEQLKIELLSQWKLEAESLNLKVNSDLILIGFDLLRLEQTNSQVAQIQLRPTAFDICLKYY